MEIIDHSPYPMQDGKISFMDRVRGTLDYGLGWYGERQAQEAVIASMGKLLSNKFVVLHNFSIPDVDVAIPIILVGPSGVQVMYTTSLGGVYRAKADTWMVQESGRGFKNARPNLLTRAQLMGRSLDIFLKRNGINVDTQATLVCASADMFVESVRPIVRIILSDAIEKFVSSQVQLKETLNDAAVRQVVDVLVNPVKSPEESQPDEAAAKKLPIIATGCSMFEAGSRISGNLPDGMR